MKALPVTFALGACSAGLLLGVSLIAQAAPATSSVSSPNYAELEGGSPPPYRSPVAEGRSLDGPATTDWPVNEQGKSFGAVDEASSLADEPDLILVQATNGRFGYVPKAELNPPLPASPAEAVALQDARPAGGKLIPVFAVDGVTVVGQFRVGGFTAR